MSKGWDNTTLKKLKALTGKGLSTAEIGKRLGMSKNAIVGKLNRLGWNLKAGGVDTVTDKAPAGKDKAPVAPKKAAAVPKKAPVAAEKAPKKATPIKAPVKKVVAAPVVKKENSAAKPKVAAKAPTKAAPEKVTAKESKISSKNLAMHQRIIQHSLGMAGLRSDQCRWPKGDPDSENFHFCGEPVFVGKPYCYDHCKQAYQFAPAKKK